MTSENADAADQPMVIHLVDEVAEVTARMDDRCGCVHTRDCPDLDHSPDWGDAVQAGAAWGGATAGGALAYLGLSTLAGGYLLAPYLTPVTITAVALLAGVVAALVTRLRPSR